MPKAAKYLLVGSTEAYSGKSAIVLGLAHHFKDKGLDIAYGKPIGTYYDESAADQLDEDVRFITQRLELPNNRVKPTLLKLDELTIAKRLNGSNSINYQQSLQHYQQTDGEDLVLLEGPGTLAEGKLFSLSVPQIAETIGASVLLVARSNSAMFIDEVLSAQERLGDRLLGIIINDVVPEKVEFVTQQIPQFMATQGIEVFGFLPRNNLLRSVSVAELVQQLNAEVLCRPDRLDLMVESLKIGAMNVNSALKYFRKASNMAVVTGGDRTDLQLAALETSTQCLILTGQIPPSTTVLSRAEDLEIPILTVDLDTLTTVEIIDRTFGQVRLHEPIKEHCIRHLMGTHVDIDRIVQQLGVEVMAQT